MRSLFQVNDFYYWEQLIKTSDGIFQSNIGGHEITRDSKICYIEFTDSKKDLFISGWSGHRDADSILGFLQHVFLPTLYYTWIDRESDGFFIPLSRFEIVKEEVLKITPEYGKWDESIQIESSFNFLDSLWLESDEKKNEGIKEFCKNMNEKYLKQDTYSLRIICFDSLLEIQNHIKDGYEDCEFEEVIEEEINMTFDKLEFICENAYDEALLNKKLIQILNIDIPLLYV